MPRGTGLNTYGVSTLFYQTSVHVNDLADAATTVADMYSALHVEALKLFGEEVVAKSAITSAPPSPEGADGVLMRNRKTAPARWRWTNCTSPRASPRWRQSGGGRSSS